MQKSTINNFRRDEKGTIAIIFASSLLMLVAVVGGAVDFARWMSARSQTLAAMDAAVLAAGRTLQMTAGDEARALYVAERYYNENKSKLLDKDDVTFSVVDGEITVSMSSSTVKTPFLNTIGITDLAINNVSKAIIRAGANSRSHLEISLMLDVTGSMCGGWPYECTSASKLDDMKAAAKDLIDIVVWDDQSEFTSRAALVPFSKNVNVGRTYFQDITGTSPGGSGDERTCVRERTNYNRYSSAEPSDSNGYFTHFDQSSGTCQPTATLMPLTSDKQALKSHVDNFGGKGGTAGHLGVQFAWYALEPSWGGIWGQDSQPMPYYMISELNREKRPKLNKIAVLLTDGEFNTEYSGDDSADQAREFCSNMKEKGITVYTVGFEIGDSGSAYDTMQACASSDSHFYNAANGNELRRAFRDIAMKISTLRLAE